MQIITNNVPRNIVSGFELTEKEKQEFDYLDDVDSGSFFRYKGLVYDIGEAMLVPETNSELKSWQGIYTESFFSGVLITITDDCEEVVVGRYYS